MSVAIDIEYTGGLGTQAVHGPSGKTLTTAAPVDNEGDGSSFSPTDLAATALGSCMVTIMGIVASRRDIELEGTRLQVLKHMSDAAPRRIERIEVAMSMAPGILPEHRERLEAAAKGCPVYRSLREDLQIDLSFDWPD